MTHLAKTEKKYGEILLDAINTAFSSLGQNVKTSIYFHLETKFGLPKQDIPDRTDDFIEALERIFGGASRQLEILIMKNLNEKVMPLSWGMRNGALQACGFFVGQEKRNGVKGVSTGATGTEGR